MGRVDCLELKGLEVWFNSDDHLAPHFHAEKAGKWEVRVFFLRDAADMIELKWPKGGPGPDGRTQKRLAHAAEAHRDELLQEWSKKVNVKSPGAKR